MENNVRLGLMIRWSYGYRYLLAPEQGYKPDLEHDPSGPRRSLTMESDENTPLLPNHHTRHSTSDHSRGTSNSEGYSDFDHSTAATSPVMPSTPHPEDDNLTSFPPHERPSPAFPARVQRFLRLCWREFLEFMNMPLWAMLVAVLVALFPGAQHYLFFEKNGFIRGSVIFAIQTCGDVSIPLILVILGANIANDDPPAHDENEELPVVDRKLRFTQRQRAIILAVATRMIIVPVLS